MIVVNVEGLEGLSVSEHFFGQVKEVEFGAVPEINHGRLLQAQFA